MGYFFDISYSKATYLNGDESEPGSSIILDNVQILDLLNVINNNTDMSISKSLVGKVVTIELNTKGSGNMTFSGASWLEKAERKVPYIYSTKDPSYAQWTGGFNSNADLTFGIGHSIKSASEFSQISNFIATHSQADIEAEIQRYLQDDLSGSVTQVNNFLKNNGITLQQHQFDAVVSLVFNYPASLSSSTDLGKELIANGNSGNFNQQIIIKGFTYTQFQGSRIDGLVTRRNNELNLFFTADYNNYYDTKQKVIAAGINHIPY